MPSVGHTPTNFEQALMEMINRARLDPAGEYNALIQGGRAVSDDVQSALEYFGVDLASFQAQLSGLEAVAPLAWHDALARAADSHSQLMIEQDRQAHQLTGEAPLGERVTAAGYSNANRVSENIYAYARNAEYAHAGFFIDWGYDDEDYSGGSLRSNWQSTGDGIQDPAGHRVAILNGDLTEIGISVIAENNSATEVGPYVVTQNFGNRLDYQPQLLGVVIDDRDGDRFYDMGEGLGGVTVTAQLSGGGSIYTTTTWASGGYQMELAAGRYDVTFSGGGLSGTIQNSVTIGAENQKLDGVAADAVTGYVEVYGTAGQDTLAGSASVDRMLIGLAGADVLQAGAGNTLMIGETLQVALVQELSDQVYRLYGATLDRVPDTAGHLNWVTQLFEGSWSLTEVAAGFVNSAEFQSRYSNTTNEEFVTLLFNNVLDRDPGSSGLAAWTGALDNGSQTRAEVVLGFSESLEYRQNTAAAAEAYAAARSPDVWTDEVYRLYRATLDREPDSGGLSHWMNTLGSGTPYLNVVNGFINSAEFQATYGALADGDFVELLYQNVLDRASDPAGKENWTDQLAAGASRAMVVRGFAESREFIADTAAELITYVRGLGGGDRFELAGGSSESLGGAYADEFRFTASSGARHEIWDFEAWDNLALSGYGFADTSAALAAFAQEGTDVVLSAANGQIILHDITLSLLSEDNVSLF